MFALNAKIKLNDLAYDAAIFVFPFVLGLLYDSLMAAKPFGLPFGQLFFMASIYFLPLLIGKMYNIDFKHSSETIRKCVLLVLIVTMFFAFGNLVYLVIPTLKEAGSNGRFILLSAIVFMIMGPIAGLMFTGKNAPRVEGSSSQMIVFLITIGLIPLFFMLVSGEELFGNTGIIVSLLIIVGLLAGDIVLIVLFYAAYSKIKKFLINAGIYDRCVFFVRILTPFCVSFLLVFFNIHSDRLFMGGIGSRGIFSVLLILVLYIATGVLPLRIMMMLTPPVKPVNVFLGVISFAVMILYLLVN